MHRRWPIAIAIAVLLVLGTIGANAATTFTDVQANDPQVAGVANSNDTAVFPTNKQNEPTIAVNPIHANYLIAGTNDEQLQPPCGPGAVRGPDAPDNDCSFFPGVGTSGVYTSSDGGATWTNRGLLPGFSDDGGRLVSDGDPVIVYGPKPVHGVFSYDNGVRAYYASLASFAAGAAKGNQAPELLTVSMSDDNGMTWSDPVIAANGHGYTFNDKEAIWVDDNPDSPFFGRAYISWTQFRGIPGCAEPVMIARSGNGGRSWTKPKQLSPAQNCGLGGRQGSVIRTGPDGTVYVAWEDSDKNGPKQVVASSTDGGKSFTRPRTIDYLEDYAGNLAGANFRIDNFASMAVDQGSGAVYVAWANAVGDGGEMLVARSTNGGRAWSITKVSNDAQGIPFFQGLDVAPNGRVDLGYQSLTSIDPTTFGAGNASIDSYYARSSNGTAWSSPMKVTSVSSDPAVSAQNNLALQFWGDYNTLVSTNDTVWFIYTDSRNGLPCHAVDAYQAGTADKPAPQIDCPDGQFGNTDAFVSVITP
jgi:hypothetical protein